MQEELKRAAAGGGKNKKGFKNPDDVFGMSDEQVLEEMMKEMGLKAGKKSKTT